LGDADKRLQYDNYGEVGPRPTGPNPFSGFGIHFDDLFGGRRPSTKGHDARKQISVSFMEAVKGCTKKISIDYPKQCTACNGNGSENGSSIESCETCGGMGKVGYSQGFMQILRTCHSCHGKGHIVTKQCGECSGTGTKFKNEILKVKIPAGIENGSTIRLAGKGMPSDFGAENGDLYLSILVPPHGKFKRNGLNILSVESINYLDAILGTKITANTIHGQVKLTVPAGTQPNSVLKIKGKGIAKDTAHVGDHLVEIKVDLPTKLSDEEKEILGRLKKI